MEFKDKLLEQLSREDLSDNDAKVNAIIEAVGEFIPKGQYNNLAQRLKNVEGEKANAVAQLEKAKETAEQDAQTRFENIIRKAEERERNACIRENTAEAKSILIEAGLSKEQIENDENSILKNIINENREESISRANALATIFKNQKAQVEKEMKDKYFNDNPTPPATDTKNDANVKDLKDMTYSEEIAFASANPTLYAEMLQKENDKK